MSFRGFLRRNPTIPDSSFEADDPKSATAFAEKAHYVRVLQLRTPEYWR